MPRSATLAFALAGVVAAALVLAPVAQAGSTPVYLFLRDMARPDVDGVSRCSPAPSGVPGTDGELTVTPPCPLNLANPQNNSSPQSRLVVPASELLHPTQFVMLNQSLSTGHIFGPIIVLLYLPESPTVQSGNMSVQLVALPAGYTAAEVGATGSVIAGTVVDLAYHNTTLPKPETLVPPDPTNATAAAAYLQGQLLVYGFTELAKAQYVLYLDDAVPDKIVNQQFSKDAKLALRFTLLPSSTPAPIPVPLPVAQAAGQPIVYNFPLTPALVYIPWYTADPTPVPQPQAPLPSPQPQPGGTTTGQGPAGTTDGTKASGAPEAVFVLGVLAAVALARRRR